MYFPGMTIAWSNTIGSALEPIFRTIFRTKLGQSIQAYVEKKLMRIDPEAPLRDAMKRYAKMKMILQQGVSER